MKTKGALLLIDLLNDFLSPRGALYIGDEAEKIIPRIKKIMEQARKNKDLIIYLCDSHRPDDPEFKLFGPHAQIGTWGAQIIPQLFPGPKDIVVEKSHFSGFFQTRLNQILRRHRITRLTMAGDCTNICVLYTAEDACNFGYQVVIPKDAVASFNHQAHCFALNELKNSLGVNIL